MAEREGLGPVGFSENIPGFPADTMLLTFSGFEGLNTKASRPAIKDQECFWLDNWMPLGPENARTLYDIGAPIFTAQSGTSITTFGFANISDTPIMPVFQADGSIVQVNTSTTATLSMAAIGTIINPTNQKSVAQWGSQYVLMCAPQTNGYFIWDGTIFCQAGTLAPSVTISNSGLDYTGAPTIKAVGGKGSGSTFSSVQASSGAISSITITNPGTGYRATDVVALAFSGGGSTVSAIASVGLSGTVVQTISMLVSGSGYSPASVTVSIQGGGGVGATAAPTVTNGAITSIAVTNSGNGYTSAPTVVITDPNNPVCQATVPIMPSGISGTAVETYTGRVWLANGAAPTTPPPKSRVQFGSPGNPADFNAANGAGAFVSTDSFLRVGCHALKQSNGFLYLIGDSSINYISGVATAGNPAITTFSNQNVDPQIGSPWTDTVQVYSRSVAIANTFGVHALYGGAVQKVSTPLDGIYTTVPAVGSVPTVGGITPSSAVAVIFGIHVYMLLLPIIDTATQVQRNALLMWDGQKWWTAGPSVSLTFIATQEINSVLTAYGTDGHAIYPLFQKPSTAITKTIKSKLWADPSIVMKKQSREIFGLLTSNDANPSNISFIIDTEAGSSAAVTQANAFSTTWTNNTGVTVSWTNNAAVTAVWQASGTTAFGPLGVNMAGNLLGMTAKTTATDLTLLSLVTVAQKWATRT